MEDHPMAFLLLAFLSGAEKQESSIPMERLEALLFECRPGGSVDSKTRAVEALSKLGDESIPVLVRALGGRYPERVAKKLEEEQKEGVAYRGDTSSLGIEYWAGEAIVKAGQRTVPALLESLQSQPKAAARVAGLLARIGDRRATPALIKILQEKTRGWYVRTVAADGLRLLKAREAVLPLIETLEEASTGEFTSDMNGLADALAKLSGHSFGLNLVPERDTRGKSGIIPAHYELPNSAPERRAAVELWKKWWKEEGQEFLRQGK